MENKDNNNWKIKILDSLGDYLAQNIKTIVLLLAGFLAGVWYANSTNGSNSNVGCIISCNYSPNYNFSESRSTKIPEIPREVDIKARREDIDK